MSVTAEAHGFRRKICLYIQALAMKCRLYFSYLKTLYQLHWLYSDNHRVISESCAEKDLEGSGCFIRIYVNKLSRNVPGAAKENQEEPQLW
jgi:hypothetical protein